MADDNFEPYTETDWPNYHEYFPASTVCLGELIEVGWFDLHDESWSFPKYSDEQNDILIEKIYNHFWNREIGALPPGIWKRSFLAKMNEIMPKYILFYKILDSGEGKIGAESEYYKSRNIYSDFPQTLLGGNSDYASAGNDMEFERIKQKDILDIYEKLYRYKDVDQLILDELEVLFSCVVSVSINAW